MKRDGHCMKTMHNHNHNIGHPAEIEKYMHYSHTQ